MATIVQLNLIEDSVADRATESKGGDSVSFPVTESKKLTSLMKFLGRSSSSGSVTTYRPKGEARGESRYYRYTYRSNGKVKNKHIPGGNITSKSAIANSTEVEQAIVRGSSPEDILNLIASFKTRD